jgi:tetratricopeptide (TPR) repeat protein
MDPLRERDAAVSRQDWRAAATICEQKLGDVEQAIEYWQRAFAVDAKDTAALDGLERTYTASARWTELTDVLEYRLGLNPGKDESVILLRSLLSIYREQLADDRMEQTTTQRLLELTKPTA